ncbi:hypothetical protein [Flavobacterium sp.]|uniref:hypothetical protein n=1 Tax=Flavobacterium sp. TaxID=239 RepID=UPI00374CEDB4
MSIIENQNYYDLCLFYKGELTLEQLIVKADQDKGAGRDAIDYGIGNWYLYHGESENAKKVYENILKRDSWSSFGYIAAEKDYATLFNF